MRRIKFFVYVLFNILVIAGCTTPEPPSIVVSLIADGRERVYQYPEPITVEQFLQDAEIEIGPLDRVNPEMWTQIHDGIRITVVRYVEEDYCEAIEIPYQEQRQLVEGLAPGETRVGVRGRNGTAEVCYRVTIRDGQRSEPVEIRRTRIVDPQDEIIWVGPTTQLEPVPIVGTLAYISNNNAWIMRGSSTTKRLLTDTGDLDPRVFSLSEDGRQLLIARKTESDAPFGNQLMLIADTLSETAEPIPLAPRDVLYAEWIPGERNVISYSTGEPRQTVPGWQALNDLWVMRIDPQSGDQINIDEVLKSGTNGGLYSWWGTQYRWSTDGTRLAWIHADAVGLVDLEAQALGPALLTYAIKNPDLGDWSWRTTVSWSPDNQLIAATVHGPPVGDEAPENSLAYDLAVAAVDGEFSANVVEKAGIWSSPKFSPQINDPNSRFPRGYLAYLRARNWEESINGEYDLVVADRDGSNARVVFPQPGQPGITAQIGQEFAWSPDGRQIALIYLGNLWIVNVETGIAHQLTQDRAALRPVWTQ